MSIMQVLGLCSLYIYIKDDKLTYFAFIVFKNYVESCYCLKLSECHFQRRVRRHFYLLDPVDL